VRLPGGPTVLVAGLGDLGGRTLELLAGNPRIDRLLGAGSAGERSAGLVAQAGLIAETLVGAAQVGHVAVDLTDVSAVASVLRHADPDVAVVAASRHSWWRTPATARGLPYGVWLPLQVSLLHTFMLAHREAGSRAQVVALAYPDAVGPVLAGQGLAPHVGAGNVAEVAAKLRLLVAAEHGVARDEVEVRLVMHHAAERLAFALFDPDPGTAATDQPPYLADVRVRDRPLPAADVDRLVRSPYPLPAGTGSHQLTAATVAALVDALLDDRPHRLHVPSPGGLPGGYPATVSRGGVELDLPAGTDLGAAVAVNERAAVFDGIAGIGADGTVRYTEAVTAAARTVLDLELTEVPPHRLAEVTEALDGAIRRLGRE
jgi:hypothetical protein